MKFFILLFGLLVLLCAERLDRIASRIIIVPQADGFDLAKDTVADLVHPNDSGAA